ncbi:MAG: hypothetical protein K8R40_09330 [Anaerolineaceae bacterium]|nr:hypothetical protein [Anaerolineaceae bacterium]
MTNHDNKTIFYYLLDVITQRKQGIPNETLPDDIKENINFAVWMQNLDFSEDSCIKASLRTHLQKQTELLSNAGKIKLSEGKHPQKKGTRLSVGALISILAGGISIIIAAILIIFQKPKKEVSDKQTA